MDVPLLTITAKTTLEVKGGLISGYASLFGVPDNARDIIEPGAFAATLKQKGPSAIRMLWQHDGTNPIGVWHRIIEDARGLYVEGVLSSSTQQGREAMNLIAQGALDGLSIGFKTQRARHDRASGCRHILALDLWEISIVTFPALPGARIARN